MATLIRDALETTLSVGVKAWGLQFTDVQIRDAVRCFEDDDDLLAAAETLNVPEDTLRSLPCFLEQHPDILESEEGRRAFQQSSQGRIEVMVKELSAVLDSLAPTLRHEVDPDYLSNVLGTLVCVAMEKFCPELREASHMPILTEQMTDYCLKEYADSLVGGGWQVARNGHAQIMATELGKLVDKVVRRQARRAFTLLVVGDRQGLAMVLAHIIEEVNDAHS